MNSDAFHGFEGSKVSQAIEDLGVLTSSHAINFFLDRIFQR
jgi:hypothetical protein